MSTVMMVEYDEVELREILTTALEGGIGYWSVASEIERDEQLNVISVKLEPTEDPDIIFNADTIHAPRLQSAINRITTGDYANLRSDIIAAVRSGDTGEIDADVADCIVQLAMFGSVMYG